MKQIWNRIGNVGLALIATLGILSSCSAPKVTQDSWSVKLSDAAIARFDSLYRYHTNSIRVWQYDNAMLGMAINQLADVDARYYNYFVGFYDYFLNDDGSIRGYKMSDYNIDMVNAGKGLITLYQKTGEQKYKIALDTLVKQLEGMPTTSEGGFWHKKRYPNQIWLDGIYMGSPFMAEYAKVFDQPEWFDIAFKQITLAYERTVDPLTGLCYHAWDESRQEAWSNPETGHSPHYWSRAMGWYMMALVDALDYFPENYAGRDSMIHILQKTSEALLPIRDPETGLWFQVLDQGNREGNYIEASGTTMFTYAFAKGANKGYLDKRFKEVAQASFDSIVTHLIVTDEDGMPTLNNTCHGAGLGGNPYRDGSYAYYISEWQRPNDSKGVAPLILAALELGR